MFWNVVVGLAVVAALLVGILFARKNPRKAELIVKGAAAAGQKAEDLAKQAANKMKGS
jgi:hypothetical protein